MYYKQILPFEEVLLVVYDLPLSIKKCFNICCVWFRVIACLTVLGTDLMEVLIQDCLFFFGRRSLHRPSLSNDLVATQSLKR